MHINHLCCCLEHWCLPLSQELWSNSCQGNQLTSLWQHSENFVNKYSVCDGVCHLSEGTLICLVCLPRSDLCSGRGENRDFQLFAALSDCVVLLHRGQARQTQSRSGQRNGKQSHLRARTGFQASHRSWNLRNFERSDPNSETGNLINSRGYP